MDYIRYNPGASLAEHGGLSPRAELASRRLKDYLWHFDRCPPARADELANLAGVPRAAWPRVQAELQTRGWKVRRGLFTHAGALAILREARCARRNFVRASRLGNAARWGQRHTPLAPCADGTADGMPPAMRSACLNTLKLNRLNRKLPKRLSAERSASLTLKKERGSASKTAETDFLNDVSQACDAHAPGSAARELANWGGWWRARYREDPAKCRTVLADVQSMAREGRLKGKFGAACYDLWHRLP